ncbi:MAG: methyltransferase domain-containing protein [Prosthecobacter sp.]|uniref:methyltransferase domain-containing protein n=1 Tax=Prosthecobacter sp. TaxID=1965333 RepID=UPI0025DB483E|nr:methyltransferase domain-containing protein [Prosthecobacter sp.]MCF7786072.1 methyltransferase domain-containing protein [Prosthecobacter sp.]
MNVTDWNQAYQENFTPWDKGLPSPPLVEWLTNNTLSGSVLVPGCGVGHDVAHLVSRGIDAYGLDIAPTAVERAKAHYPQLAERFVCADLFEFRGQYDAIVEHTCLCALPPEWRTKYRDAVTSLLKPGGLFVGVFFINPEMDPGETGPPFGISPDELTALFAEHFQVLGSQSPTAAYPGREGRESLRVMQLTSA